MKLPFRKLNVLLNCYLDSNFSKTLIGVDLSWVLVKCSHDFKYALLRLSACQTRSWRRCQSLRQLRPDGFMKLHRWCSVYPAVSRHTTISISLCTLSSITGVPVNHDKGDVQVKHRYYNWLFAPYSGASLLRGSTQTSSSDNPGSPSVMSQKGF